MTDIAKYTHSKLRQLTLVLNASYLPVTVCTAERAIGLLFLNKVMVLESYDDQVHSPSITLSLPSVVVLRKQVPFVVDVKLSRRSIMVRDKWRCQYCGSQDQLTLDHVVAKSKGGPYSWTNLVAACIDCNNKKADKSLRDTSMRLMARPIKPSRFSLFHKIVTPEREPWKQYLFTA